MRLPRPTPALVIACVALLLAVGGGSYAVATSTGSAVNIVDPTDPAQIAKVNSAGKLLVGDASGALTVDGTVFARPAKPTSPFSANGEPTPGNPRLALVGPTSSPIDLTALSVSAVPPVPSGTAAVVHLLAWTVPGSATNCDTTPPTPASNVWLAYLYAVEPEI